MTDTVTATLAEWEALVEGATPGEWEASSSEATVNDRSEWRIGDRSRPQVLRSQMRAADAEFIAHSRTAMPALLGFVREVVAKHVSSRDTRGVGQVRDGVWTAYCEEDFESWPCPTEQAARKWIGGEE